MNLKPFSHGSLESETGVRSYASQASGHEFEKPQPCSDDSGDLVWSGMRGENNWRHALVELGHLRAVCVITSFSIVCSVSLTAMLVWVQGVRGMALVHGLLIGAAIPAVVAPLAVHWFMGLIYDLEAARVQLLLLATKDIVTGAYNRRYLMAQLEAEVERTRRTHLPVSLVLFDVDHFKQINDGQGHAAGDFILHSVTQLALALIRPYDVFARYGGDEFIILMPNLALAEACTVAERIRTAVCEASLPWGETVVRVTVSVGISSLGDGEAGTNMIGRADAALYMAKRMGRDRSAYSVDGSASSSEIELVAPQPPRARGTLKRNGLPA